MADIHIHLPLERSAISRRTRKVRDCGILAIEPGGENPSYGWRRSCLDALKA